MAASFINVYEQAFTFPQLSIHHRQVQEFPLEDTSAKTEEKFRIL